MCDLLVASIPFTYTYGPSLGPALLKACCEQENINTIAWDLSADFNHRYENKDDYNSIISWFQSGFTQNREFGGSVRQGLEAVERIGHGRCRRAQRAAIGTRQKLVEVEAEPGYCRLFLRDGRWR